MHKKVRLQINCN